MFYAGDEIPVCTKLMCNVRDRLGAVSGD